MVEAIPEVGGAKSSQSGDNSVNKLCSKERFCGNTAESITAEEEIHLKRNTVAEKYGCRVKKCCMDKGTVEVSQ